LLSAVLASGSVPFAARLIRLFQQNPYLPENSPGKVDHLADAESSMDLSAEGIVNLQNSACQGDRKSKKQ
jgi:hypothetical protein